MSLRPTFTRPRAMKGGIAVLAIGGALLASTAVIPSSGALFSDAKTGTITTTSGTLVLASVGSNGTFDTAFNGLSPSYYAQKTYVVKNAGTIAGTGTLQIAPMVVSGGNSPSAQYLHYTVAIDGSNTSLTAQGGSVNLGLMQPNDTRTIVINASLDSTAGNEWQGVTVTNAMTVSLQQVAQ